MLNIRDMIARDWEDYLAMATDFYSGDATLYPVGEENFREAFRLSCEGSPWMRGLLLEWDGRAAGYAQLAFYWSCESGGMVVQLEELYICESMRSRGLGKEFFGWMFRTYPEARRFRLEVCPQNPRAKALYESLGFKELPYIQMIRDIDPAS